MLTKNEREKALRAAIAAKLEEHETRYNLTQKQMAAILGVKQKAYGKYKELAAKPNFVVIIRVCKLVGISPEQLVENCEHC